VAHTREEIGVSCQRTAVRLRELQAQLYKSGLTEEAASLEPVIKELITVAFECSGGEVEIDEEADTGVFRRPTLRGLPPKPP